MSDDRLREQLVRLLDWEEAHVGFDKAVDGLAADTRGARAPGFEHSPWELLFCFGDGDSGGIRKWRGRNPSGIGGSRGHARKWNDTYGTCEAMASGPMPDRPDLYVVARFLERLWREGSPMLKTRLQVAANVNYDVFSRYLLWLLDRGLVY